MTADPKNQKLRVLLVEDDEDDYVLTQQLFADIDPEGIELEWISSYDEAIARDEPVCFDVCLLDYRLGERDGLELMAGLQERGYNCPMILLTGQSDIEIDRKAMKAGAADYLVKGQITAALLERSVRYAVQHKQLEDQRINSIREQEARARAEAASNAKDEFLATLSHELRTPLNVMLGWVQLLKKHGRNEETYEKALDAIERSARTQTQLVDDLLDVARITNNSLELTMRSLDLVAVIEPAVEGMRPVAESRGVKLELTKSVERADVLGDSDRLQQVVNNLLSNAIKFTPEGGEVNVSLKVADGMTSIIVRDTGKGVDPEFLPHIFERYSQAKDTQINRKGGLGLGLAIVSRIVELHGGTIKVASDGIGKGATFTVEIPNLAK